MESMPTVQTDNYLTPEELEMAIVNLIEIIPHHLDLPKSESNTQRLIKAFNEAVKRRKANRAALEEIRRESRARQEEEWRLQRYAEMREACDNYKNNNKWLSAEGYADCCTKTDLTRPHNIGCDLEVGTPGNYYDWQRTYMSRGSAVRN